MIGENVQKLRKLRGISVKQISDSLGISASEYYKYEQNTRNMPLDIAYQIAQILDVTLEYLINMNKNKAKHYTLDQNSTKILNYLMTEWDGDYNSMIQLLGTYASMPVYMRKDVAEHCICMFVNGIDYCNTEITEHINVEKCKQIVARMNK